MKLYSCLVIILLFGCNDTARHNAARRSLEHAAFHADKANSAQTKHSLLKIRAVTVQDTSMISHYSKLAEEYWDRKLLDSAIVVYSEAINYSLKTKDLSKLAPLFNSMGMLYDQQGQLDTATCFYQKALREYRLRGDSIKAGEVLVNIGIVEKNSGDYSAAMRDCVHAAEIFKANLSSRDLSDVYTVIGNTLKGLNDFDGALNYHKEALALRQKLSDPTRTAGSLNNIGNIYRYKKQYKDALHVYLASLDIKIRISNEMGAALTIDNIAETYAEMGDFPLASTYFQKALNVRYSLHDTDGIITTLNRTAQLYLDKKEASQALSLALEASSILSRQHYLKQALDNSSLLSKIYLAQSDYRNASEQAQYSLKLKDSILSTEVISKVTELEKTYKIKEKEKDLKIATLRNEQQNRMIDLQRILLSLLVLGILLLVLTVYLIARLNKQTRREKRNVEMLMEELRHRVRNNLQVVISLIQLQSTKAKTEQEKLALSVVKGRVRSINAIHDLLDEQSDSSMIRMGEFVEALIKNTVQTLADGQHNIEFEVNIDLLSLPSKVAISIALVINEWLTNIYKHGIGRSGVVRVLIKLTGTPKSYQLQISDDLAPWDEKTNTGKKGLGLQLIAILSKQLNTNMQIENSEHGNTLFLLSLSKL